MLPWLRCDGYARPQGLLYDNRNQASSGWMLVQAPPSRPGNPQTPQTAETPGSRRQDLLAGDIQAAVKKGWRVESQSDYQAVVIRGRRPNHLLHLLLSIVTLGLWLPVWFCLALLSHERRIVITVDSRGVLTRS